MGGVVEMAVINKTTKEREAELLRRAVILKLDSPREQRIQRIRKRVIEISNPTKPRRRCSINRARIVTKSYQETEGEPTVIRRAKAFYKVLTEIPIFIADEQLFVGEASAYWRGGELYPDPDVFKRGKLKEELDVLPTRDAEPMQITEEDKREYLGEIAPCWHEKSAWERVLKALPPETRKALDSSNAFLYGEDRPHYNPDQQNVLEKGFMRIKKEVEEELKKIDLARSKSIEQVEKYHYLSSQSICCDAIMAYAKRYANEARKLATQEQDPKRKAELEKMAEICEWVPANPARTFWEALQSAVLCYFAAQLEFYPTSWSYGRFDRLYYPYLKRDLEEGRITKEEAQELLECFFLNCGATIVYDAFEASYLTGASQLGPNLTLGGMDERGYDVTNELAYMVLEAQEHTRRWGTLGTVRIHKSTPDGIFLRALEVIRLGGGIPQLLNDEITVPSMMQIGCRLEDARNYVPHGCVELAPDGNFAPSSWPHSYTGHLNLLKCVNLALHDGVNPLNGEQVGPKTGDPTTFKSFDELMDAVGKQIEYFTSQVAIIANIFDQVHAEHYPIPFTGLMNNVKGRDLYAGGAHYNWTGNYVAAQANAGDSLTAIKKLVFEEKKITMAELIKALDADWEGYGELRQMCKNTPKYGNNDDYADSVLRRVVFQYYGAMEKNLCVRGGTRFRPGCVTVTAYIPLGLMTAASADGRKSGDMVSDSVAPMSGCDVSGPTQAVQSVAKMDHIRMPDGVIYNMKFHPGLVQDERGLRKWMDLIKTYFMLGGMQVQINVVGKETLLDAQKHPDKYQDLLVRVAGYSARFVDLEKAVQDSIIARTEHNI